jgi:hypothetical protein
LVPRTKEGALAGPGVKPYLPFWPLLSPDRLTAVYAAKAHCEKSAVPMMAEPLASVDGKKEKNQTLYI